MLSSQTILTAAVFVCLTRTCIASEPRADLWQRLEHLSLLPRIDPEFRERVLVSLPTEGEVRSLAPEDRRKLESVAPVLKLHGRDTDYIFKVVESPQARIAIHARFVLLITYTALRVLTPTQLQALVAHEIGHEYVWEEYDDACKTSDWLRVRELELFCDGVAVQTLLRIGAPPSSLIDALRIVTASNQRNGLVTDRVRDTHPSLAERARFSKELEKRLGEKMARLR